MKSETCTCVIGTCLFYLLLADIIMIIMFVPPAWSLHDCPIPANEAGPACFDTCHPAKPSPQLDCLWSNSFICLFSLTETLGPFSYRDPANPLMNMPVKMKMKAPVNYLHQHSARQIHSNKKEKRSHYRWPDLSMCWSEKLFTRFMWSGTEYKCAAGPHYSYSCGKLVWETIGDSIFKSNEMCALTHKKSSVWPKNRDQPN